MYFHIFSVVDEVASVFIHAAESLLKLKLKGGRRYSTDTAAEVSC